jgi:hypothetical protein
MTGNRLKPGALRVHSCPLLARLIAGPVLSALPRLAAIVPLFMIATVGCGANRVVRIRAGQSYQERPIDSQAYAAFMRARIYEAKGDTVHAALKYEEVLSFDPQAAEAWVRLGKIYCASNVPKASEAWLTAEQLDPESPDLWIQRGRCEYRQDHFELAQIYARLAIRYEPTSAQAAVLIAETSSRLNRREEAATWLRGACAMSPTNVFLWQTIFLSKDMPDFERRYAARQLATLRPPGESSIPLSYSSSADSSQPTRAAWKVNLDQELETALGKNDTAGARRVATFLGLNPEQLALRALIEGAYNVVLDEAELLLAVDSNNASAWILGLVAADRGRDDDRFKSLLARSPKGSISTDAKYHDFLVELIGNRVALDTKE